MPAWPGGPCPSCGDVMPKNVVRCQNCRTLLNSDLEPDIIEVPEFIPLQEIESMVEVELGGYYVACPHCKRELRVGGKYVDENVQCKFCESQFTIVDGQFVLERLRAADAAMYGEKSARMRAG